MRGLHKNYRCITISYVDTQTQTNVTIFNVFLYRITGFSRMLYCLCSACMKDAWMLVFKYMCVSAFILLNMGVFFSESHGFYVTQLVIVSWMDAAEWIGHLVFSNKHLISVILCATVTILLKMLHELNNRLKRCRFFVRVKAGFINAYLDS